MESNEEENVYFEKGIGGYEDLKKMRMEAIREGLEKGNQQIVDHYIVEGEGVKDKRNATANFR